MITFLTVPFRCAFAFSPSVNNPVDSTTTWAPNEVQSRSAGSFSLNTLTGFLLIRRFPSLSSTLPSNFPRTESYLRRCARTSGLVMSLIPTISIRGSLEEHRTRFLPMRPNPLIATLIDMAISPIKLIAKSSQGLQKAGISRNLSR